MTSDKHISGWRIYTDAEIDVARRELTRRYKVDATDYEAVWLLRDRHEPGWRERKDRPPDRLLACVTLYLMLRKERRDGA
jgi:hypothetical protein